MTIYTPEVASLCGAIDSDAVDDGDPYGAHWLRPLIRSANRMTAKDQLLFALFWPELPAGEENAYPFEGIAPIWWVRAYAPVPVWKRPGLTSATSQLRISVPTGEEVEVYIASSVRPWHPNVTADLVVMGSGSFANETIEDLPINEAQGDEFEIWVRGRPTANLANTGTFGAPNTRSSASPTGIYTLIRERQLNLSSASWNSSGINSLAQGAHFIRFLDGDGNQIGPPRMITGHYGVTGLVFEPPLTEYERARCDDDASGGGGGDFEIYKCPTYAITNWLMVANQRSP